MTQFQVTLPRLAETTDDFFVVEWLVAPGEPVDIDQVMLRVETDKAIVDVPSTVTGILISQLVSVDDEVVTGATIAIVETTP